MCFSHYPTRYTNCRLTKAVLLFGGDRRRGVSIDNMCMVDNRLVAHPQLSASASRWSPLPYYEFLQL